MSATNNIKIAIIGAGHIGLRHAASVIKCPTAQLLCLVDPIFPAKEAADSFAVPLFPDIKSMLKGGCLPDGAVVCTPNTTHVEVSKQLLAAGIDVLVEKPIATDIDSGTDLIDFAREHGRHLLVGHHRRFNAYIVATRKALEDGMVGRPIAMSGLWMVCKPDSYFSPPMDWRAKAEGGGPVLINLIHEVDILQYLFGPIAKVYAEKTSPQRDHDVEEGAAILLRFRSGLVGTFVLSDATPSTHSFESATGENPIIPQTGADVYRIFGEEGTISVGDMKVSRHATGDERSWRNRLSEATLRVNHVVPLDEQMAHFVRVISALEEPRCSGEDGLRALRVCEAVKLAMHTGLPVEIPA